MTTAPEPLPTRLREAADDITFTGRPDPHDDKALLREAAAEIEHNAKLVAMFRKRADRLADESGGLFRLLYEIAALDPDDTAMSKVEFRGRVRELAQQRMAPGVGAQPGDQWTELDSLRTSVAAQREHAHDLAQYIVAVHKPGQVDTAAVAILDGYHVGETEVAGGQGEHTLAAAVRLLKLARERGAYASRYSQEGVPNLPELSAYLRGHVPGIEKEDPEEAAHVASWANTVDDANAVTMYLVDAHRPGEVDEEAVVRRALDGGVSPIRKALNLLKLAKSRGAYAPGLADPAAEVKTFNADETTLNARTLVTTLAGEFSALASALDRDGFVPAADPQMLKIQEAIEGLDQLTRDMQPGEDGPVTARGEPLGDITPADEHPDLMGLGERARMIAKNLNDNERDPGFFESDATIAAGLLREVADTLAPVDEGSAA